MQWNLKRREMPKSAVSIDRFRQSNSYFLALPVQFFRQNVLRQLFTWVRLFVSEYQRIRPLHQNWNPCWINLAKCRWYWYISMFQLDLSKTYIFKISIKVWFDCGTFSNVCQKEYVVSSSPILESLYAEHAKMSNYFTFFLFSDS